MISLIVSSYKEHYFQQFSESVSQTIGVPFEIIRVHNPGTMSICQAYNQGAEKAQYPYLCFVHEDVEFRNLGWGKNLIDIFTEDETVVLAGVAGSRYKLESLSGWATDDTVFDRINITQGYDNEVYVRTLQNLLNERYSDVRTLDGVFLFTRKSVWEQHPFNEDIKGFHFYDIEYSLRLQRTGRVVVVFPIDLVHYSEGNYDIAWLDAGVDFHKKYKSLITDSRYHEKLPALAIRFKERWWCSFLLKKKLSLTDKAKVLFLFRRCYSAPMLILDVRNILRPRDRYQALRDRLQQR